jgi:hypothetical protein
MYVVVTAIRVYQSIVHVLDVHGIYYILATLERDCGRVHRAVSYICDRLTIKCDGGGGKGDKQNGCVRK